MSDIKDKVRTFIVDNFLFGDAGSLNDETSFLGEGIIDSTGILEMVDFIEETFGFSVEDDELVPENLDSIKNLEAYITRKTQNAA
ncbi:acyl carrier protein [Desulfatiferula olefinivorans]